MQTFCGEQLARLGFHVSRRSPNRLCAGTVACLGNGADSFHTQGLFQCLEVLAAWLLVWLAVELQRHLAGRS